MKQLEEDMGISMEMGTIHAGDFLVGPLLFYICGLHLSELRQLVILLTMFELDEFLVW